jgi:hypothetical protein
MADTKITALAAIATVDPAADVLPIVDISDTSMAASGTTKKVTTNQILQAGGTATLASATITGAATVGTTLGVTGVSTLASATITGLATVGTTLAVGTVTPDIFGRFYTRSIGFDSSGTTALQINGTSYSGIDLGAAGVRTFGITASGTDANISTVTNIPMLFGINNTEAMRLNSTANLVLKGGTVAANGVGVTFPATQVASSDANCLDDYEEGTFTPTVGGTATYTAQTGTYTKVGRLVTASFDITILLRGTGDSFAVGGLPFAASANVGAAVAVSYFSGLATSSASIYGYVNTSAMAFNLIAAGGGTSPSGAVVITDGTRLAGTAVYMV